MSFLNQTSKLFASERRKTWFALGFGLFLFGVFLKLSSELLERETSIFDNQIISWLSSVRIHFIDHAAIEITALGSTTLIALFILTGITICIAVKNRFGFYYLLMSSIGSACFTFILKNFFERPRPNAELFLVDATGYSYPSGHSFGSAAVYFSIAILCASYSKKIGTQFLFFCLAAIFTGLVGFSRIYLGAHYPTDVASGILLGTSWSLICFSVIKIICQKTNQ